MNRPDTVYKMTGWSQNYLRPESSNEERLTTEALAAADIPGAVLQATVRPPLPQVQPFPPRVGYDSHQPDITDVVNLQPVWANPSTDFSGRVSGYSGTAYPSLNVW